MEMQTEYLATSNEEYEVCLVVPIQGTPNSMILLTRLVKSLYASDFPKRYLTILTVGEGYDSRKKGVEAALEFDTTWILQTDNDCYVPPNFWTQMVHLAESDSHIGAVGAWVNHEGITAEIKSGEGWDGFSLFRSAFLRNTEIREGGSYDTEEMRKRGWRTMIAPVTIYHDKGVPVSWKTDAKENLVLEEQYTTLDGVTLKLKNTESTPISLTTCYVFHENCWRVEFERIRNPQVIFGREIGEVRVPSCSTVKLLTSRNNQFMFTVS